VANFPLQEAGNWDFGPTGIKILSAKALACQLSSPDGVRLLRLLPKRCQAGRRRRDNETRQTSLPSIAAPTPWIGGGGGESTGAVPRGGELYQCVAVRQSTPSLRSQKCQINSGRANLKRHSSHQAAKIPAGRACRGGLCPGSFILCPCHGGYRRGNLRHVAALNQAAGGVLARIQGSDAPAGRRGIV